MLCCAVLDSFQEIRQATPVYHSPDTDDDVYTTLQQTLDVVCLTCWHLVALWPPSVLDAR
jgi:hypothetical protein